MKASFVNKSRVELAEECRSIMGSSRRGKIYELVLVQTFYNRMLARPSHKIFLDIGGNTGSFALLPVVNRDLYCHTFEPNPYAYNVLKKNIKLNSIEGNVSIWNLGVWSEERHKLLKIPKDMGDSGLSTFGDDPSRFAYNNKTGDYETFSVLCVTIDSFAQELGPIDAIKIDTEGAELDVLKGARETLIAQRPLLLFEYDNKNTVQFGYNREDIIDYLKGVGYVKFDLFKQSDMFAS